MTTSARQRVTRADTLDARQNADGHGKFRLTCVKRHEKTYRATNDESTTADAGGAA